LVEPIHGLNVFLVQAIGLSVAIARSLLRGDLAGVNVELQLQHEPGEGFVAPATHRDGLVVARWSPKRTTGAEANPARQLRAGIAFEWWTILDLNQ
jgi:hypothetical protein